MRKALNGAEAATEALRQIDPEVFSAYPITPVTGIAEGLADLASEGRTTGELLPVESEHSALSVCIGASACGARTATATSSQGLLYMFELLGIASGLRLPILMFIGNRAISAPINIHCDHSDSMAAKDSGWLQVYCETAQEVYDLSFIALKLAESASLPIMLCQDGFITTHTLEPVKIIDDAEIKKFIGFHKPKDTLLNTKKPKTMGHFSMPDSYFEFKEAQEKAMSHSIKEYSRIIKKYSRISGEKYPPIARYKTSRADFIMVSMSSVSGIAKDTVDELRKKGIKVGFLKIRLFRPFPYKAVCEALKNAKGIAVLDRTLSFGSMPPLYSEIKNCFMGNIQPYVFGLGGRDITKEQIHEVFKKLSKKDYEEGTRYIK
jgi:pyruvate ferredoxin oxidoreductase alpha subunit